MMQACVRVLALILDRLFPTRLHGDQAALSHNSGEFSVLWFSEG